MERTPVAEAARRGEHARLIAEQRGDPRFVSAGADRDRVRPDVEPGNPADGEFQKALAAQRARFLKKFGREMSDDDPLVIDPDADEPTPLTDATRTAVLSEFASSVADSGLSIRPISTPGAMSGT